MHRVAFSVDDIDKALEIAVRHGCRPLRGAATYEGVPPFPAAKYQTRYVVIY